jgi:hypothetical protein
MKTIQVWCEWRSYHELDVPDDFEVTGNLSDFQQEALDQMTATNADLIDWGEG